MAVGKMLAVQDVLGATDLVCHLLQHLDRTRAVQIATVNRAFCKAVRELTDQDAFRPRVFVADSKAVLAHELDVEQGCILKSVRHMKALESQWLTGIAVAPDSGRLCMNDYQGYGPLLQTSESWHLIGGPNLVLQPEGLVAVGNDFYLASAEGSIVRLHMQGKSQNFIPHVFGEAITGEDLQIWVPWGLCAEGDYLYVAAATSYETSDYTQRTRRRVESVILVTPLTPEGDEASFQACTTPNKLLLRPSSICFDGQKRMLVTSMTGKVLLSYDKSIGLPWGVEWAKGYLIVTVHSPQLTAKQRKERGPRPKRLRVEPGASANPRIYVYNAATMRQIHCIQDERLQHPNMLTWDKAEHSRGRRVLWA